MRKKCCPGVHFVVCYGVATELSLDSLIAQRHISSKRWGAQNLAAATIDERDQVCLRKTKVGPKIRHCQVYKRSINLGLL